ncbi:STAS domain-containing protein [Pinirhizobacter soli]|uniref:STAS domain-containing protein n=1 Tax=Pinirhizobacter soli TaxID=2786953 RepID=UPI00202A4CDB|nr:STAS domain-containing protein [Pinirhizobacter soli]
MASRKSLAPIALDADLRLSQAPALRERLLKALAARSPVTIDGGDVAQVDTAALQVLCAFTRDAAGQGLSFSWGGVSGVLRDGAAMLGLDKTMNLPVA